MALVQCAISRTCFFMCIFIGFILQSDKYCFGAEMAKNQSAEAFLRKGGFRVFHFDQDNIADLHKLMSSRTPKKRQTSFKVKQNSPSSLSKKIRPRQTIRDFEYTEESPINEQNDDNLPGEAKEQHKVKATIKNMIDRNMKQENQLDSIFEAQQDRILQSAIFKETMRNIIHKARHKRQQAYFQEPNTPERAKGKRKKMKVQNREENMPKQIRSDQEQLQSCQVSRRRGRMQAKVHSQKIQINYEFEESNLMVPQRPANKYRKSKKFSSHTLINENIPSSETAQNNSQNYMTNNVTLRSSNKKELLLEEKDILKVEKKGKINDIKTKTTIIHKYKKTNNVKVNGSLKTGKTRILAETSSEQEFQTHPFPQNSTKVQQIKKKIIENLPDRNPKIVHSHNSIDSKTISIAEPLKMNKLYFASRMVHFDSGGQELKFINDKQFQQFVEETARSVLVCKSIPDREESTIRKLKLKRNFEYQDKKTILLDLDETLIHSAPLNTQVDKTVFPFEFEFDKIKRHYAVRMYAQQLIRNLASRYYLVVFTSAVQGYADKILEHLDPEEKYIQHRLYRFNCYCHGLTYPHIKDLRILNRDLSQVILVDNSLFTFWFNIDNGVPILPFKGVQDNQLISLERYLFTLQNVDDVRQVNRRAFHMHLFKELDDPVYIIKRYYELLEEELGLSKRNSSAKIIDLIDLD